MNVQIRDQSIELRNGRTVVHFLKSGDLFDLCVGDIMINQVRSNILDGSLNNIYLRVFNNQSSIRYIPLFGIRSVSSFSYAAHHVRWTGSWQGVAYDVLFSLTDRDTWFWTVTLGGDGVIADLVYTQDLGLANPSAVMANEAYISQYIDHLDAFDDQAGYVIGSRQNQKQASGNFPAIRQGILNGAKGFLTDGFQFYGLNYKKTDRPEALEQVNLVSEIDQYEFAMIGLQSRKLTLDGTKKSVVFFANADYNHPERLTRDKLKNSEALRSLWKETVSEVRPADFLPVERITLAKDIGAPLQAQCLSEKEIDAVFPERQHEERQDGRLLSFFTPDSCHIVLQQKELLTERPHGHILMSGNTLLPDDGKLASTVFMYGIFNSQVVAGNTSMNKMMSNSRNALNVLKTSGQRIYVKNDDQFHLLTMPSLFEMDVNWVRWWYKTASDLFLVTVFTSPATPRLKLTITAQSGKKYQYLITQQILMNDCDGQYGFMLDRKGPLLCFKPDRKNKLIRSAYPNLTFYMCVTGGQSHVHRDERLLSCASAGGSLVVLAIDPSPRIDLTIQGSAHGEKWQDEDLEPDRSRKSFHLFLSELLNGFDLSGTGASSGIGRLNTMVRWYAWDMLVHYLSPHGLEQYGGAAWGTRDVCQGPFEFFMATQHFDVARSILTEVYSHQYEDDGNWPQWFMFDRYSKIQFDESHGDIIVWPMKALGDYLQATGDQSILKTLIPYMKRKEFQYTDQKTPLLEHLKKELQYIQRHFLPGTYLSCYGNGDWDDTLQPADPAMKNHMASSWTVALTYQAIRLLSETLHDDHPEFSDELRDLSDKIGADFRRYLLCSLVIPGFLYMPDRDRAEEIIYPGDEETGIDYRLLPMTRSMIAELFTPEEEEKHFRLIRDHLKFPDGVRLMNRPARYSGGVSIHFKRAEQAANFGREVGLMYVHAHIRYVEAMAKTGHAREAWEGLSEINPIDIGTKVKNAAVRQANTYFSSSDGAFRTRYEAQNHFDDLRLGKVQVKGGWRIYSSGPGILVNQLVTHCLGIREQKDGLVIDPVLPGFLDGLQFRFVCFGRPAVFVYHLSAQNKRELRLNGQDVVFTDTKNPYRPGGMFLDAAILKRQLIEGKNVFDIFIPQK